MAFLRYIVLEKCIVLEKRKSQMFHRLGAAPALVKQIEASPHGKQRPAYLPPALQIGRGRRPRIVFPAFSESRSERCRLRSKIEQRDDGLSQPQVSHRDFRPFRPLRLVTVQSEGKQVVDRIDATKLTCKK